MPQKCMFYVLASISERGLFFPHTAFRNVLYLGARIPTRCTSCVSVCKSLLCTSWASCGPLMIGKQPLIQPTKSPLSPPAYTACLFLSSAWVTSRTLEARRENKKLFYTRFGDLTSCVVISRRRNVGAETVIQNLEVPRLHCIPWFSGFRCIF